MARRRRILLPALLALGLAALLSVTVLTRAPAEVAEPTAAPTSVNVSVRATLAVITWSGSSARHLVEITTNTGFSAPRRIEAFGGLTVVDRLLPTTRYLVRVRAITPSGEGPASEPVEFVTLAQSYPLSPPALALSSETSTTLTADWLGQAPGSRYLVELSSAETFADPTRRVVTDPGVTFEDLSAKQLYFLRARVIDSAGKAISDWSTAVSGKPTESVPLTVGTYNILKERDRAWSKRKPALVQTILGEDPDVVGLQEATPARTNTGRRQYADLTLALGPDWALVDALSRSTGEVRTVYNTTRLELISHGHDEINGSRRYRGIPRYVTWAVFAQRATGKQFIFVNTHFVPRLSRASDGHRAAAARELVAVVRRVNTNDLPVIIAGDFNSGQNRTSSNRVYSGILAGGYRDPLAGGAGRLGRAEKTIRANVKTVNRYRRAAPKDSFAPMVDHIFVSPMRVMEWEVVARLDGSGRFIGTIPSDHNMIRVTVELP